MKRRILYLTAIACIWSVSCQKINEVQQECGDCEISASIADIQSKVSMTQETEALSLLWEEGDCISVIGNTSEVFSLTSGAGTRKGSFSGKAVTGSEFTVIYPGTFASVEEFEDRSYEGQEQTGNGSTKHLSFNAIASGLESFQEVTFTKTNGVIKFYLQLPDDVHSVSKVTLKASSDVFYRTNAGSAKCSELSLKLHQCTFADGSHILTAYMSTSIQEAQITAGETLTVSVASGNKVYSKSFTPGEVSFRGGVASVIKLNKENWTPEEVAHGLGTEESPYLIDDYDDLLLMHDELVPGEKKWFRLLEDIDMAGINWKSLNGADPYNKEIDFDGDGHSILNFFTKETTNYPSFFGVLYGKCHDVKFIDATVKTTASAGILGGYCGTTGKPGEAENAQVQGTVEAGANSGGLFGQVNNCKISRCSADVTLKVSGQNAGGLFGRDRGNKVEVSDCWTSGVLDDGSSICGGICGDLYISGSSIRNCYSTMKVETQFLFGGIVGRATAGSKSNSTNCANKGYGFTVEKCIAWNTELTSCAPDDNEHYSSGAIIGATGTNNTLSGCVRKADIKFTDCPGNRNKGYDMFDQEDAGPTSSMSTGTGTYAFAYHGKAAAAGETLSQVAQRIGWSSEIWDFSNDIPTLK